MVDYSFVLFSAKRLMQLRIFDFLLARFPDVLLSIVIRLW